MGQANNADSGIQDHRVEFVRESSPGTTPADPAWNLYSDTLESALVVSADAQIEEQYGVGDVNPNGFFTGPEDHTASIEYHLQNWFVDGSGNPLDAAGDALVRGTNGEIQNTHTIVDRATRADGTRVYTVLTGGHPNLSELTGDPGSGMPVLASLDYEAKLARRYKAAQPSAEQLTVKSTSANDTTQTLTIENDDATTTDDVPLNGTTGVVTETDAAAAITFDSIDAFKLDAETEGDVIIEDSSANELARIKAGDFGVPLLGAGSHAGAIGTSYEQFIDDTITRGGNAIAAELRSAGLSASNSYEKAGVAGSTEQAIHAGQQSIELSATIAGDFAGYDSMEEHLRGTEADIVWTMDGGTITLSKCALTSLGDVGPSAGEVISTVDNAFTPSDITIN